MDEVGAMFGPIMVAWFLTLAALGMNSIFEQAAAYGASVNATMLVTTILAFNVARADSSCRAGTAW
ncbi:MULTISPECIES: KUP/HAK/KT family potassium transporter [Marinobacter]|uniref:K+ potassium transporter integral membrane domain-containing protein n=1 Tax=Marinobacter metalliresistant TaxID=2961995 RepID=A0ABZ2W6X4_9GAMM|nr:KUP/HAK/KT family potassium transporter [Marinobacter sp. Arc7-DN-1]